MIDGDGYTFRDSLFEALEDLSDTMKEKFQQNMLRRIKSEEGSDYSVVGADQGFIRRPELTISDDLWRMKFRVLQSDHWSSICRLNPHVLIRRTYSNCDEFYYVFSDTCGLRERKGFREGIEYSERYSANQYFVYIAKRFLVRLRSCVPIRFHRRKRLKRYGNH